MANERRVWEELSVFESQDFVGKWYNTRHGRTLNATRKRDITSCFSQGREYVLSASNAATSVRPLLLYYGVLSLSRGLILLLDREKNEESLRSSHGLEVVDWRGTLTTGIENVLDLKIRATNGTFGELVHASKNKQATAIWSAPRMVSGSYTVALNTPNFTSDRSLLALDDLLSRDLRFLSLYERTTERASKVHISEIVADGSGFDVSIFTRGGLTPEDVVSRFGLPTATAVESRMSARRMPIPNLFFRLPGDEINALKQLLPATQYVGNDGMFLLQDFSNGDRLSELLRTFLISYILGMLVRYFPARWIALLRNENGDMAQPVLMAAVNAIESDFPKLIADALS
jgi:hypothetical protein